MASIDDLIAADPELNPGARRAPAPTLAPAPSAASKIPGAVQEAPWLDDAIANDLELNPQRAGALRVSVEQGMKIPALTAANHDYLSKVTGIPLEVVKTQEGSVQAIVKLQEMNELAKTSKVLSERLLNPDFLAQAHEDKPALTALVDGFKGVLGAPTGAGAPEGGFARGTANFVQSMPAGAAKGMGSLLSGAGHMLDIGARNLDRAYRGVFGDTAANALWFDLGPEANAALNPATALKTGGKGWKLVGEAVGVDKKDQNLVTDVGEGVGQLIQQVMTQMATGGQGSLMSLYSQGVDSMAEKVAKSDVSQAAKDTAVLGAGAVTAITEKYGIDALLNRVPPAIKNKALQWVSDKLVAGGIEASQEIAEGVLHDTLQKLLVDPNVKIGDGAGYEATVAGFSAAFVRTALGLKKVGGQQQREEQQHEAAQSEFERLTALLKAASDSTLRKNNPSTFAEVTQQIAEENKDKGAPTEVRFDARTLGEVLNQEEIDSLPSVKQQLESGELLPGDEITVPIGELLANVAGTPLEQKLMEHARVGENEYSQAEAKEASSKAADYLAQESQRVIAAATDSVAHQESANKVKKLYLDQFNQLGRFTPDVNEINAIMVSNMYVAMGAREGLTPEQAQQKRPLVVTGVNPARDTETLQHGEDDGTGLPGSGRKGPQQKLGTTVAGKPAAEGWAGATRISRKGEPILVHRGAASVLNSDHFKPESLGKASGNPSSGLGVWFTTGKGEASRYGKVESLHLDIRNPKVIKAEDLPGFDSVQEAHAYREELRAQGYDGIVITAKHLGKQETHVVAFDPHQAIKLDEELHQGKGLSLDAYHFSKEERPNLDTGHYGTGLKGSGRETYQNASDKRLSKRLSFYVDTGHGVRPESGVGGIAHKVHLTNIYDSNTDPLRLKKGSQTDFESRVLDAGYSGYLDRLSGTQPGHVILLGDQSVKPEVLGPMSKVEGTTPVAPAGPRASLGRDVVLDQLRADKSLPAGSVPLSRWKEVLAKDPEVLDAFERAGVLDAVTRELDGSLRGLPRAIEGYSPSVFNTANAVAESYMASRGEAYNPPTQYVKVDKPRAERIAKAFEEMKHDPQNPEVKAAYNAMIDETLAQYEEILKTGIQIEFVKGEDPYKGNPRNMTEDVRKNNHMWVFSTREGFGTDTSFDPKDNPLLAETKYDFAGEPALANDIFRAVHDYFGHVKEGLGFRADGEENAWRAHAAMFSPLARRAMTTETRGQNSWLNFGPHGESNRTAKVEDTHFADQKIGLLPQWVTDEGRTDPPGPSMYKSELFKDFESKTDEPVYGQNEKLAELARIEKHLTDKERGKLNKGTAAKLIAQFDKLPAADEFAAVAWAGRAKRGWYKESANAIGQVFGPDAPRFAGLLAAMSPQNSVQTNLLNSLNMWKNWTAAGRPQTREEIIKVMGASVEGSKGVDSVLDAWVNNSVRALTTENPGIDLLSGPKVDSFMRNLLGNVNEVTNDAWMSNFALVDQKMFKGGLNKTDAGKGPGYLAMNAKVREAAKILTKRTGETWTPAEVQETIWSWAKTLYEAQTADKTAREILMDEELTDDMIRSTPDFKGLFYDAKYEKILRDAGLGDRLSSLNPGAATTQVSPAGGETAPFDGHTQARHENRAAKRLEILRRDGKPGGDVLDQKVDGHVVNIGLDVEGGEQLKPQEVLDTLQSFGVKVEEHKVHTSNTEPTVVARLDRPLTPEEANAVSVKLKQQAIAQMSNGEGSIHGPQAEAWSPFNPDYFLALNGQPASALEQPGGSRGTYNPRTLTISLLENANLSTFHHEMAHFYLDALAQMATDGNPNATDDMGKLLKWFGVDSLDTWNKMSLNEKRASHEKFAEHYETYLFEGKAPSKELHSTFRRLASWMMNAYKNMMEFLHSRSTSLTPEVRGVYDRMLATEAQIAETEATRKMTPMFKSAEEANMDSAEWAQYQLAAQDASEEAIEKLRTRSLRDLKWSISAHNKAIKTVTKDVEAKRKATEAEVRAEVEQMPVYVAKSYLDSLGKERNDADIQFMSEQLGYTSPDEMLRAIKEAQPIKHVIEGMTDQRLLERYGDLTTPKGIEAAANEAIHNEARAKFVATELQALEDGVRLKTAADTTVLEKLKECLKA